MRSKKEYIERISEIVSEYSETLKRADLELYLPNCLSEVSGDLLHDAYMWLKDHVRIPLESYAQIRRLCSEDVWRFYETMGDCDDLAEVKLLTRARIDLKKVIVDRNRPILFKKGKMNEWFKKLEKRNEKHAKSVKKSDTSCEASESNS